MIMELQKNEDREVTTFKCKDCGDFLIMHENVEHKCLSITILESALDEIINLTKKKEKPRWLH